MDEINFPERKIRAAIITPEGNHLQFLMNQLNLDKIIITGIVLGAGTFASEFTINHRGRSYLAVPYEMMPEAVLSWQYDYIIVLGYEDHILKDLKEIGIPKSKIVDMRTWYTPAFSEKARLFAALENSRDLTAYKIFVTGISYAYLGIEIESFQLPAVNAAGVSQDIYYDFRIADRILSTREGWKYAVIGLSPYSFHHDLSKGAESWRVPTYALSLSDTHNYHVPWDIFSSLFQTGLIRASQQVSIQDAFDFNDPIGLRIRYNVKGFDKGNTLRLGARKRAETWKAKRFPETVNENINILREYLNLCMRKNVFPILTIFPVTDIYRRYFSKQILEEFYGILSDFQKAYDIKLLDYFSSSEFTYDDFFDVDHLNRNGALKVSRMINDVIMDIERC